MGGLWTSIPNPTEGHSLNPIAISAVLCTPCVSIPVSYNTAVCNDRFTNVNLNDMKFAQQPVQLGYERMNVSVYLAKCTIHRLVIVFLQTQIEAPKWIHSYTSSSKNWPFVPWDVRRAP